MPIKEYEKQIVERNKRLLKEYGVDLTKLDTYTIRNALQKIVLLERLNVPVNAETLRLGRDQLVEYSRKLWAEKKIKKRLTAEKRLRRSGRCTRPAAKK